MKFPFRTLALLFTLVIYISGSAAFGQTSNAMFDAGLEKYKNKDYAGAIEEFSNVIKKTSYFYEAHVERARCYHALKQNDKALDDCNKALEINREFDMAYLLRGGIYLSTGNTKAALADFNKCIEINPDYLEARLQRVAMHKAAGRVDEAIADMTKAIKLEPENAHHYYERSGLYRTAGKKAEVKSDLSSAIKKKPDFAAAYYERGIIFEEDKDFESAIADYNKAIELNVSEPEIYRRRAGLNFSAGNYADAIPDYCKLIVDFKLKDLQLQYQRGMCYYKTEKYPEALKDFTRVASLDRENESANLLIAEINIKMGKATGALPYFARVLAINPKNVEVREKRAQMYFDQKKYQLAINDLDEAVKLRPRGESYYLRAICKDLLKDKKGACDDLFSATQLGHKEAETKFSGYCR